ncbi:type I restriction-modification system subunit M [Halogeometricum sp. S1BR25-6]|uniref:site-specific DNA-methyltransferase (adenine-specific) n=1 Tax=Halogeometricum salsisoli TaxID=2950536 RepID=A0ABU2GF01_9EURY|nr:class I SAM-dependent DNA methyltransferase [Halogeometricum sp. S1BR25-6]MDS0299367.1 type I restriction-modification system subunit M [Halogeometricum sp. S1BR25-6]
MDSDQETLSGIDTESETLDLDTLETHLWGAADILRGSIDAADYKNYIFGILFLKRINDRFEEETEEMSEKHDIPEDIVKTDRDLHDEFWVPERARWSHISAQESDIGATLNKALEAVEDENDVIADRVLTSVDFNDKDRLSDATLDELVTHFSKHRYRNEDLVDPDIFGRAYEYLIRQFADDAGKKGGEFYTPREIVQLLVECVDPEPGDRVYDPACGSGGMLIYSAQHVEEEGGDRDDISLYGQEKNLNTWAIGQMNVLLHELQDADIAKGDTIRTPKFVTEHDELEPFDRVVANPPWNQKSWNKEWVEENEPYNRFPHGLPPKNRGDWAWIQLMIASLSETGKAGIVMDNGVLFRSRSEKKIRKPVLEADLIEAVIALPENLFYNTSSPGCILIMNKDKPAERKDKVQFIYAEDQTLRESGVQIFEELSNQNQLTQDGVAYLAETHLTGREEEHHSRLVDMEEIEENDWSLSVPRYVDTTEPEEPIDVSEKLREIDELETKRRNTKEELQQYMEELEYQ